MSLHQEPEGYENRVTQYLEKLLEVVERYAGKQVVREFRTIKSEREKYLQEQWIPVSEGTKEVVLRDVDYQHLLTLLTDGIGNDFDQYYQAHKEIVSICMEYGKYDRAFSILETLSIPNDDSQKQAEYHMLCGKMYLFRNAYEKSVAEYKQAMEIYRMLGDNFALVSVYNNLGILAHEQWQIEDGKYYFEQAKELALEVGKDEAIPMLEINLGIVHNIHGESEKAYALFSRLHDRVTGTDHDWMIQLYVNHSISAKDCGRPEEGKRILEEAQSILDETRDSRSVAIYHLAFGEVLIHTGEYEDSLRHLGIAFKIFSQLFDLVHVADTYRTFAMLHMKQGYYELAESEFRISLRVNQEKGNVHNLAVTYYEYSKLAEQLGKRADQEERLHKSLSLYRSIGASQWIQRIQRELNEIQ